MSLSCLSTQYTTEQRSSPLCGGLHLGLSWVVPAKAKTQLTKAQQKLREDHVDRHRCESFAKVADWAIFYYRDISRYIVDCLMLDQIRRKLRESNSGKCSPRESRECGRESIAKAPCEYNEIPDPFRTPTVL